MHQQEVVSIVFQSEVVGNPRSHRNGTHTRITNQRVQFLVLRQEQIHQLDKANTTHGGDNEGTCTNGEDINGVYCQKL